MCVAEMGKRCFQPRGQTVFVRCNLFGARDPGPDYPIKYTRADCTAAHTKEHAYYHTPAVVQWVHIIIIKLFYVIFTIIVVSVSISSSRTFTYTADPEEHFSKIWGQGAF